jgi:sRNA-binding regulator protein Hfq
VFVGLESKRVLELDFFITSAVAGASRVQAPSIDVESSMSGGRKAQSSERPAGAGVRAEASRIAKETGIPQNLAHQVAMGNLSLNDVLSRMATRAKVDNLMKRHGLPKSLATQVALGQADLAHVLRKRRLAEHIEGNRNRSILAEAMASGEAVAIGLHERKHLRGTINSVDQYEVKVTTNNGEVESVHKLQIKFACLDAGFRNVRSQIKRDKTRTEPTEPIWKPQDRYGCSDRRLFGVLDEQVQVVVTTLEGDIFHGLVEWMGRWEFGMVLKKKNARVVVFRHALAEVRRA